MKTILANTLTTVFISVLIACSQSTKPTVIKENDDSQKLTQPFKETPHQYGGWYCPDNLNGFPAVDILEWKNVPVVNGRMATKEETQNGTSLIFVDLEKHPRSKPLNMEMPRLATYENPSSHKTEFVIVIQALNIQDDSIVGFRYLNGGNGSARFNEVRFLSDFEINQLSESRFYTKTIRINATAKSVKEALSKPDYANNFVKILANDEPFEADWREKTNVNYHYQKTGERTAMFAEDLFGNYYVQNDYDSFTEKFLVLYNQETKEVELKIVCGPFLEDFPEQERLLNKWALMVKSISEQN